MQTQEAELVDIDEQALWEEQYRLWMADWLRILSRLWTAYDKPPDENRLMIYRSELSIVPLGLLEKAVSRTIREHQFNSVPTIAQVWAAVRKELDNPYDVEMAIREWCDAQWRLVCLRFPAVQEVVELVAVETVGVA